MKIIRSNFLRNGRPLAARLNFAPSHFIDFANENPNVTLMQFERAIKIGMHELTHALGFSQEFYTSWLDASTGKPWAIPFRFLFSYDD